MCIWHGQIVDYYVSRRRIWYKEKLIIALNFPDWIVLKARFSIINYQN